MVSVNWVIIDSGNGLLPIQCQGIMNTDACLLWIGPLGTSFNEIEDAHLLRHKSIFEKDCKLITFCSGCSVLRIDLADGFYVCFVAWIMILYDYTTIFVERHLQKYPVRIE